MAAMTSTMKQTPVSVYIINFIAWVVRHSLSIFVSLFFLLPFFIMVTTAFKEPWELYIYPIQLMPVAFNPWAFRAVFETIPFWMYFQNTLIICVMAVLGVVTTSPMVAYSLARLNWRGRDILFLITLSIMMIPFASVMVPIFLIMRTLGLVGTFFPLFLPQWFGVPFFIFLLRQFFKGLPRDLEDAARIDGAGEFSIYFRIFLPLCKPALLTVGIMQFLASWNDLIGPMIYLRTQRMYTLAIGLQQFQAQWSTEWNQLTAAASMMSIPLIVTFFIIQKQFMTGITFSGIKD